MQESASTITHRHPVPRLAWRGRPAGWKVLGVLLLLAGCATPPEPAAVRPDAVRPEAAPVDKPQAGELGRGLASWYGPRFHGRLTASGERFDMEALTAAHRSLPFGARVKVRNLANGQEVVVRINDRGPQVRRRIIDLSKAAAAALGLLEAGEAPVALYEP